ncbi:YdeI family protein [Belliella marina]|uniref:YdeI family protein n=1 Tax=Belliella marina TaxID=1644146 RepID=A0ABW4VT19_9BACT
MNSNETWTQELNLLKEIIHKTELEHAIKWGIDVYTYEGHNVIGICGFKSYFGIWFYNGVFINDHMNVFVNAQEGKTKAMRQWRMNSIEDIDESTLISYIQEAIANEKTGKRWVAEKSGKLEITGLLAEALEQDQQFKLSFEALSPGKQKEYFEHIQSAKRAETQQARLEKIKPMVLEGKGLNDKYKK